ncbi:DUF6282 family protein [Rhodococcus spongiicola]|uniref:Cytosolic protein n=1 Tax=Rhodococcus spongiicola TaxID=2487352 RepID=A0A438B757_9NOCA|nr:DUF6282 family protein [Rhodococcus spongiicola]RVW06784.1 hypothetical protein EF834_03225 [Rhodococcus spongiicola]
MFDLHVHAAPDVWERSGDDAQILRWYADAGFSGCVLKGHYDGTAGRAQAANAGLGLKVYGGQALNHHVGGINPAAVAAALMMGARVIWMPTADAHTQHAAGLPRLCCARTGLDATTYAIPPVDDSVEKRVLQVLDLIAEADAVLATGHLSTEEVAWLIPAARAAGVRRLLLTHPSYTVPAMSAHEAVAFTEHGAFAEITAFQLLHQRGMDAARLAALVRTVGYDRTILSSDAGQPDSPPPPEALLMLIEALAAEGLDRSALIGCASDIPEALVTP